jgi:hypothetical protein
MEFGRVIPEAEEALEHSLMMPPALDSRFSPLQLKQMARDVDGLINRLPYHRAHLQPTPDCPSPPPPDRCLPQTPIGKYNPMGQLYRY